MREPYIIAVVGAGGKTTHIHRLAGEYRKAGKRVLVTTTTHMRKEEGTVLAEPGKDSECEEHIKKMLSRTGYCMAGSLAEKGKIGQLPQSVFQAACETAQVVLVEADGARHRMIKYPAAEEPVIPEGVNEIHVVMGMAAIGKKCQDVSHREKLVEECLGIGPDTLITAEHIRQLAKQGYEIPLSGSFPNAEIRFVPGKCDSLYQRVLGECIREGKEFSVVKEEWFYRQPHLFICGCGHVAGKIAVLGRFLDFQVTVMDDRKEFANSSLFPDGCGVICDDFSNLERYLNDISGENVYYAVVTRGHMADRECVEEILKHPFAYLGMIGSRAKVKKTLEILEEEGYGRELTGQIHAPIGLAIGSQTPEEIAVSIAAELIQVKNQRQISSMSQELNHVKEQGVFCVITEKHGSAPRGVGSGMFVCKEGGKAKMIGSVGGGSVEHAAIERALFLYDHRKEAKIVEENYDLSDRESGELGMICGGSVKILFIPIQLYS